MVARAVALPLSLSLAALAVAAACGKFETSSAAAPSTVEPDAGDASSTDAPPMTPPDAAVPPGSGCAALGVGKRFCEDFDGPQHKGTWTLEGPAKRARADAGGLSPPNALHFDAADDRELAALHVDLPNPAHAAAVTVDFDVRRPVITSGYVDLVKIQLGDQNTTAYLTLRGGLSEFSVDLDFDPTNKFVPYFDETLKTDLAAGAWVHVRVRLGLEPQTTGPAIASVMFDGVEQLLVARDGRRTVRVAPAAVSVYLGLYGTLKAGGADYDNLVVNLE